MRNFLMSAMALTAVLVIPGVASASDVADRNQAISICRAEVQAQAGADANVRLDQVRVRPRAIRVDLDLWRGSLVGATIRVSLRRYPAAAIPTAPDERQIGRAHV